MLAGLVSNTPPECSVAEFERHDDDEQFLAGLDLLLAGLRLEVRAGTP